MERCKIIARYGIGVDTIDLEAATEAGIIVTNNPTYCIDEVAEHTMALVLACARKATFYDRLVRSGRWEVPPGKPMFRLAGRTLGLVGFGNIARAVAARAAAFGMRILYCDPFVRDKQFQVPGEKRQLDEMLRESDFVSVHPPLTPDTRGMINDQSLAKMKPTAFLINCARGPIVDTQALVRALDSGRIAGCALDTTDPEPLPNAHPLRGRENVTITPHVAWYSEQAMVGLQSGAPNEVRRVLTGEWPINVVNPAVLPVNTFQEFLAYAKAQGPKLHYASAGNGSPAHLCGELLKTVTGLEMVHVPYKGGPQGMHDVVGGRVGIMFAAAPTVLPQVRAGKVRGIAMTGAQRSVFAPEIPTIAESGFPEFDVVIWNALFAPGATPSPILARLHAEIGAVLAQPDTRELLLKQGAEPTPMEPAALRELLQSEYVRWGKVIREARIKVD